MRVSAKADYGLRAMIELAVIGGDGPVKGERIAQAQEIPLKFLENILVLKLQGFHLFPRELRRQRLAVVTHELDADLEAEMDQALHHRFLRRAVRLGPRQM